MRAVEPEPPKEYECATGFFTQDRINNGKFTGCHTSVHIYCRCKYQISSPTQ